MSALDAIAACAGEWRGSNRLHDPNTGAPEDTHSTLAVHPVLGGRFVRLDYTWSYQGKPQEGSLLLGHQPKAGVLTGHWIDGWHMGDRVLSCEGRSPEGGELSVLGHFPAPPGPDWGWRIEVRPDGGERLRVVHVLISPEGEESPAVEADYVRAGAA